MDAADSAGAAVLAALLAGQRRLLVDVRDAELVHPETLVQFMELAVLPVAAGLEGLQSKRNRLKIVFPKVSQLLEYRKTMALAAPEVGNRQRFWRVAKSPFPSSSGIRY